MLKNVIVFLIFLFLTFQSFYQNVSAFNYAETSNAADKYILLGASNAQSGPAAQLGLKLNAGARVYFEKINKAGGIAGHKIKLLALDDGYEPFKAVANTQKLLKHGELFSFFNFVGTPTSHAAFPIVENSKLPFITPFTGAHFLHQSTTGKVYNLRASYFQEAFAQIEYLVAHKDVKRVGILIQADEFGLAVQQGYEKSLSAFGLEPAVITRYRRNTEDIDLALELLIKHEVDVVAFVGTYIPMAELIAKSEVSGFTPYFTTVSFISSRDLFQRIDGSTAKVLVTEVVPDPNNCNLRLCVQFLQDIESYGFGAPDHVLFEGYLNAYAFIEAAKACGHKVNQECVLSNLNKMRLSLVDEKYNSDSQEYVRFVTADSVNNNWSLVLNSDEKKQSMLTPPVFLHFYPN